MTGIFINQMVGRSFSNGELFVFILLMIPCIKALRRFIKETVLVWWFDVAEIFFWVTTQWPSIFLLIGHHGRAFAKRYCSSINAHMARIKILRETEYAKTHGLVLLVLLSVTLKWWFWMSNRRGCLIMKFHELYETGEHAKRSRQGDLCSLPKFWWDFCFGRSVTRCFSWWLLCRWRLYQGYQWISFGKWW